MFVVDKFPALPWRRRLLMVLLAVATAAAVVFSLLAPPGGSKFKRPDVERCAAGQTTGCVGGTAGVIPPPRVPTSGASR